MTEVEKAEMIWDLRRYHSINRNHQDWVAFGNQAADLIEAQEKRIAELEAVTSCLLSSYLFSTGGEKDALAWETERLIPDWEKRAEEWEVPK